MAETDTLAQTDPNPAPTSAPAPSGDPIVREGTSDWRGGLPDDLKAEKALADFKDVGSLAKSYVETKRMVGDAVKIPGEKATPEERAAFHRKLGVPESPDKYPLTLPAMPEGHPAWEPERVAGFRGVAHQAGLTPAQVQTVVDWYAKDTLRAGDLSTMAQTRAAQAEQAEALKAVEREWGPRDGPTWQRNKGLAERVVRHFFGGDQRMLDQLKMGASDPINPGAVLGLARLGEATMESIFVDGETPGATVDKEGLSRQITETRTEMEKVNAGSRRYGELRDHLDALYKQRYAGGR